ncbi:tetratricopeptide repeat protein [Bacillus haynesii]|nr:tetratricopeptide repeat protein [Bacillus haynesii]MEC0736018.1 tetratricopeptide repeat protein [Bacillus haynesii]
MGSYFSKKNTGGSFASKGYEYQDYCCLSSLFSNLVERDFLSLSIETINDFSIIYNTYEISIQVKRQHINMSFAKSLLEEVEFEKDKIYEFIGTSIDEKLANLMTKVLWFKNIINSNRNEHEKVKAQNSFINELKKNNFDCFYEKLLNVRFKPIPEEMAPTALYANFSYWIDKNKTNYNKEDLLNALLLKISKMRSDRSYFTKDDIEMIINKYKLESSISEILDELYERKFKTPPEILKVLGEDKDEILKSLEIQINKADNFIKEKEYTKALSIFSSLAMFYEREQIFINCAMLNEITNNYKKAIDYCEKVLSLESNHFEAYFILGTSYGQLGQTDKSLEYLKKASKLNETPELYYNLGYTYYLNKDNDKAYYNYSKCLELDDNMAAAHLNISDFTDKLNAIQHLDRAIELDDTMFEAYGKKGEILRDIGLYDIAVKYFEKCLELDEKNYQALQGICFSLMDLGKYDEAIIYLTKWIKEYKDQLFSSNMENGQSNVLIDINWHRTRILFFKKLDEENIILNMPDGEVSINLFEDKGLIFIGAAINNETGIIPFPLVGKIYDLEQDYERIKNCIIINADLKKIDTDSYIDGKSLIKIKVIQYYRNTYVSITVGDFKMSGFTEENSQGIEYFLKGVELRGCLGILIKCREKNRELIIKGVTDIIIEKNEDEPLKHLTNNINEEMINKAMEMKQIE